MTLTFLLYLTDVLLNIKGICCVTIGAAIIISIITLFMFIVTSNDEEVNANLIKFIKYFLSKVWIPIIALLLNAIIPSKTTMYMMLASNYLSNSNIPTQVNEIITLKLSDIIKDLKEENKK